MNSHWRMETLPTKASAGLQVSSSAAVIAAAVLSSALTATLMLSVSLSRPTPWMLMTEDRVSQPAPSLDSTTNTSSSNLFALSTAPVACPPAVAPKPCDCGGGVKSRFHIDNYGVLGPAPWDHLTPATQKAFTLDGKIDVEPVLFTDQYVEGPKPLWDNATISQLVSNARTGGPVCSYGADAYFYGAFKDYPLKGKSVLVVGSQTPWAEAYSIAFEASAVTTVDFNVPISEDPRIRTISIAQLDATDELFDVAISYSSLEHDGLGRYGDPLNPNGDILRMKKIAALLKPGGIMYLGVPNGPDLLVFNGHRIYGPIRFPMLIEGWELLKTYAAQPLEDIYKGPKNVWMNQPLHALKVKAATS